MTTTRRRGVFRLNDEILHNLIDLPEGQRIIGFREDSLRLSIDVCVEGEGLPECAPGTQPETINAEPYTARFSRWAFRGRDLEEMVRLLAEELSGNVGDASAYGADLLRILDGTYDPRLNESVKVVG